MRREDEKASKNQMEVKVASTKRGGVSFGYFSIIPIRMRMCHCSLQSREESRYYVAIQRVAHGRARLRVPLLYSLACWYCRDNLRVGDRLQAGWQSPARTGQALKRYKDGAASL